MKSGNKMKKLTAVCAMIIMLLTMLTGCGTKSPEELLETMKPFTTADGSASVYLNENWTEEDLGVDFWLCAGNALGNQVCVLFQSPKGGTVQYATSLEEMIEFVESTYSFEGEAAEAPEIAAMTNVSAKKGKVSSDGITIDGYAVYGETDYAYYGIVFIADKMSDSFLESAKVSCTMFEENPPEIVDNTSVELTDTIRWFNASYAILTDMNGWDYNRFGGLPANEETMALQQQMLTEWWSVTDRASADETLQWAFTEGHRTEFAEQMQVFEEAGLGEIPAEERESALLENYEMDEAAAAYCAEMYAMYEEFGSGAIDGWDYCRALNLCSYYYLAGYYTEQEALDASLQIAQAVQPLFSSWDELVESYMRGYEYWAEESADERRAVYEEIKTRSDSPYAVDYSLALEKSW